MTQPPTKLFREEGKTGAIECPACGAPITLHAFGAIEQVACSFCGTVCKPEAGGALDILQRAQRQRRPSVLPLHQRGEIDGVTWEIIGITWREVVADGARFPWQEFLLFNPYQGYRWLIYAMTDGVWSFGGALPGAAEYVAGAPPTARWQGETYKHFTSGTARTTYVEGEFPWQVLAGDAAETNDYICPPKLISIEVQHTKGGADLNFTQMRPIDAAEVWAAFKQPGTPPRTSGIHPAAPNPHVTHFYWAAAIVLFAVWVAAMLAYSAAREHKLVYRGQLPLDGVVTETIDLGEVGQTATLELELRATGMNNSWAYADVLLVDAKTEEAIALGLEVDYYSGVDGGESWSEGSNPRTTVVGGVPGGEYLLQITTQTDKSGDPADQLTVEITRDVPLIRYMLLPLLFILGFPAINFARRMAFETRRWSTSDHAPTSNSED